MIKSFFIFLLFSIVINGLPVNDEMKFIREHFYKAVESEEALEKLESYITSKYSSDLSRYPAVILAYRGGIEALKAKYIFSPFAKFGYVTESLDILEKAVKEMPGSLEIRFIRYSILDNIPFFMGYNDERKADKKVIISELIKNDFSIIDKETQKGLINYLIENSSMTDEEKQLLTTRCTAYKN